MAIVAVRKAIPINTQAHIQYAIPRLMGFALLQVSWLKKQLDSTLRG
jgi:hypothetical protein